MGQLNQPQRLGSYETVKRLYEATKPLQRDVEVRPIERRQYYGGRVVKRGADYIVTNNWQTVAASYYQRQTPTPAQKSRMEKQLVYSPDGTLTVYFPVYLNSKQQLVYQWGQGTATFVDKHLPAELTLVRYDTKVYVQVEHDGSFEQFVVPRTLEGLEFKRIGSKWECLNPVQEVKKSIDRKALNEWMKTEGQTLIESVWAYYDVVDDLQIANTRRLLNDAWRFDIHSYITAAQISPHTLACAIKHVHDSMYQHKYKDEDAEVQVRNTVRAIAPYLGNCFTTRAMPVGAVARTAKYAEP